ATRRKLHANQPRIASHGRPRYAPFSELFPLKFSAIDRVHPQLSWVNFVGITRLRRSAGYPPGGWIAVCLKWSSAYARSGAVRTAAPAYERASGGSKCNRRRRLAGTKIAATAREAAIASVSVKASSVENEIWNARSTERAITKRAPVSEPST